MERYPLLEWTDTLLLEWIDAPLLEWTDNLLLEWTDTPLWSGLIPQSMLECTNTQISVGVH